MKHKVTFIGAGYVGIVNALGMASRGTEVWLVDNVESRIEDLKNHIPPIYEAGIELYIHYPDVIKNMHYTTDLGEALHNTDYVFIAVGTPQSADGSADLSAVYAVAHAIGQKMDHNMVVVVKSTVPVGTTYKVESIISDEITKRCTEFRENIEKTYNANFIKEHPEVFNDSPMYISFGVADNPEFLKEGQAFKDFNFPDRIIIGTRYDDDDICIKMEDLYINLGFDPDIILKCSIPSAELIKYASNSMLAMRISFANMMADMCTKVGADIDDVMNGVGRDKRIGNKFLQAGIGYGGSCFPKDVASLNCQMDDLNINHSLLDATRSINYDAKQRPFQFLLNTLKEIDNKTITVWGGAFKAGTDDIRESPFLDLIHNLRRFSGVTIKVYDKLANNNIRRFISNPANQDEYVGNLNIEVFDSLIESVEDTDVILLMTPPPEHDYLIFDDVKEHTHKETVLFYDCRNYYKPYDIMSIVAAGFKYSSVGRHFDWLKQC